MALNIFEHATWFYPITDLEYYQVFIYYLFEPPGLGKYQIGNIICTQYKIDFKNKNKIDLKYSMVCYKNLVKRTGKICSSE